jgi:CBS domain-containing protein
LEKKEMNVGTVLRNKGSGVVTTTSDASLFEVAKLLARHGIGCIVIVGENDKIAGIISERDLMCAIGQAGPEVLDRPVSDFMTRNVVTARKADTTLRLMSEMTAHRVRHIPIVETGRLMGLISIGDLVKIQTVDMEMEATATREFAGY